MLLLLGKLTQKRLDKILAKASKIKSAGERIGFLSEIFLDIAYKELTLIGDEKTREALAINLKEVDCFTYIDYIEAMRLSGSFLEFVENLKRIRYRNAVIAYENRNHFFTDWLGHNSDLISDYTEKIGGKKIKKIKKVLNEVQKGIYILEGIASVKREIIYIPSDAFDSSVIKKIKTGDYAGIYSNIQGLDVSHVGIIIKQNGTVYLRHASSDKRKVIDQDLKEYISDKPGIIILRPKDQAPL